MLRWILQTNTKMSLNNNLYKSYIRYFVLSCLILMGWSAHWSVVNAQEQGLNSPQLQQVINRLENGESIDNAEMPLQNLNFGINRAELSKSDENYLSTIARLMETSDNLVLEITGHTDPFSDDFADVTSKERAEIVRDFLQSKGIAGDRLLVNHVGDELPLIEDAEANTDANRRTELSFVKDEDVELQDWIVYKSGKRVSGSVITANVKVVKYVDSKGNIVKVNTEEVKKVEFSNGKTLVLDEDGEKNNKNKGDKRDKGQVSDSEKIRTMLSGFSFNGKIRFAEPDIFGNNIIIVQGGYNLRSNLGRNYKLRGAKTTFPPLSATIEYGISKHFGLGVTYGHHQWAHKPLEFNYRYQSIGVRGAFHWKMGGNLDPYIGVAYNYRRVRFLNDPALCGPEWQEYHTELNNTSSGSISFSEPDPDNPGETRNRLSIKGFDPFIGLRVFVNDRWGVFGEWGPDALGFFRVGTQFVLVKKHRILEQNKPL